MILLFPFLFASGYLYFLHVELFTFYYWPNTYFVACRMSFVSVFPPHSSNACRTSVVLSLGLVSVRCSVVAPYMTLWPRMSRQQKKTGDKQKQTCDLSIVKLSLRGLRSRRIDGRLRGLRWARGCFRRVCEIRKLMKSNAVM